MADDLSQTGGGAVAGGGSTAADSGVGGGSGSDQPAEPTIIELDDNALIKPRGFDKPVKYGEHVRGLQSQFTKASQRAAQLERELQAEREAARRATQQSQQPQQQAGDDLYEQLGQLPYLSGKDAAVVVQSIAQQIQMRDRILLGALQQMKNLQGVVQNLNQTHSDSAFDARIGQFLQQKGYPADYYADLAKEVFLAYEGDDLWEEFPAIFEARIDQLRRAFEAERQARVQANRKQPFVPGKGGSAQPSKPLNLPGSASAAEIAEALWGSWNESGT